MRAEDQLKAEEEEEAQEIIQGLDEGRDEEQAEEQAVEDLPHAARHFTHVVATMRAVLEGHAVDFEQLELRHDEREALEVLQQVVSARGRRGGFIFAEERIQRLNQVLSVLQPALSIGSVPGVEEMRGELMVVIDEVQALRQKLDDRDAAEEEHIPALEEKAGEGDKDDDDDEDDGDLTAVPDLDAPARSSTLTGGKAAPERPSTPTTLTGTPAAPDLPVRPTTLVGSPEAPDFAPPPSTLSDEPEAAPPAGTEAGSATRPARARKVN